MISVLHKEDDKVKFLGAFFNFSTLRLQHWSVAVQTVSKSPLIACRLCTQLPKAAPDEQTWDLALNCLVCVFWLGIERKAQVVCPCNQGVDKNKFVASLI